MIITTGVSVRKIKPMNSLVSDQEPSINVSYIESYLRVSSVWNYLSYCREIARLTNSSYESTLTTICDGHDSGFSRWMLIRVGFPICCSGNVTNLGLELREYCWGSIDTIPIPIPTTASFKWPALEWVQVCGCAMNSINYYLTCQQQISYDLN